VRACTCMCIQTERVCVTVCDYSCALAALWRPAHNNEYWPVGVRALLSRA
jgi:hypothetical protein